ncbi:MAG: hypothetical protein ACI311_06865 [Bacilli bacterium]
MSQLTKKTKWVLGGLVGFALVATTATTLATWVIGQNNASGDKTGNITVTDASNENVSLTLNDITDTIVFGPKAGDNTGFVKSDGNGNEQLSFTISGKVTYGSASGFTGLKFDFSVATLESEVLALVGENYIVLPTIEDIGTGDLGEGGTFSVVGSFAWGSAFGGENPSEYFDDSTAGEIDKTVVKAEEVLTKLETIEGAKFKVTVTSK